jgi:Lrp/AsnC family transcriptional regulator, leucine-responsive regulatory protein
MCATPWGSPDRMKDLDDTDRLILDLLQQDDRMSLAVLGKQVGLAPSSVNDRMRRLVDRGAIKGFHARLDPEAVGLELLAFVFVGWSDPAAEKPFLKRVAMAASVQECHHVTGEWNYLLKVRLANTRQLETFLNDVIKDVHGVQRTETLIVLSSAKETSQLPVSPPAAARKPRDGRTKRTTEG